MDAEADFESADADVAPDRHARAMGDGTVFDDYLSHDPRDGALTSEGDRKLVNFLYFVGRRCRLWSKVKYLAEANWLE